MPTLVDNLKCNKIGSRRPEFTLAEIPLMDDRLRNDELKSNVSLKQEIVEFTQFLNLNNAYDSFMLNFNKFNPQYDSLEEFIQNLDDPKSILEISFDWYRTDQGFKYWNELNTIWYKLLHNEL